MAVRFSSDASSYSRTLSLGATTQFTVCCWVKISTDRNTFSGAWCVDAGSASDTYALLTGSDGTTIGIYDETTSRATRALTVGTWYYIGVSINGANGTMVSRSATETTFTVATWSTGSSSTSITNLRIGRSPNSNEYFNGCVAAFRLWTGVTLTQAEMEAESWAYLPRRTGLRSWHPLLVTETADYSGNSNTLSGGTGATTEDGPPIGWRGGSGTLILPGDAVTGDLTATLPTLEASTSGQATASGTLAGVLPALTATASGEARASGTADAVLPTLTATASGAVTASGTITATLPGLTASTAGTATAAGTVDATLPAVSADLSGAASITSQVSATLPAMAATADATVTAAGTLSAVLPTLGADLAASGLVSGTADTTLPLLTSSLDGALIVQGSTAPVLPALTGSLAGTIPQPRGIHIDVTGLATSTTRTPTGLAASRTVEGVAFARSAAGAATRPALLAGPGSSGPAPDGLAVRRQAAGVATSRAVTGVGV